MDGQILKRPEESFRDKLADYTRGGLFRIGSYFLSLGAIYVLLAPFIFADVTLKKTINLARQALGSKKLDDPSLVVLSWLAWQFRVQSAPNGLEHRLTGAHYDALSWSRMWRALTTLALVRDESPDLLRKFDGNATPLSDINLSRSLKLTNNWDTICDQSKLSQDVRKVVGLAYHDYYVSHSFAKLLAKAVFVLPRMRKPFVAIYRRMESQWPFEFTCQAKLMCARLSFAASTPEGLSYPFPSLISEKEFESVVDIDKRTIKMHEILERAAPHPRAFLVVMTSLIKIGEASAGCTVHLLSAVANAKKDTLENKMGLEGISAAATYLAPTALDEYFPKSHPQLGKRCLSACQQLVKHLLGEEASEISDPPQLAGIIQEFKDNYGQAKPDDSLSIVKAFGFHAASERCAEGSEFPLLVRHFAPYFDTMGKDDRMWPDLHAKVEKGHVRSGLVGTNSFTGIPNGNRNREAAIEGLIQCRVWHQKVVDMLCMAVDREIENSSAKRPISEPSIEDRPYRLKL